MVHLLNFVFGKKDPCLLHISGFFHPEKIKNDQLYIVVIQLLSGV